VKRFEVSRRSLRDLQEIWEFISADSFDAADRVLEDFYRAFARLAGTPGMGHKREDLTHRDVRFWRVHSYLVIYRASKPIRIVRVLHGKRDVKRLLGER
jgi:toxin ParE1/3/4